MGIWAGLGRQVGSGIKLLSHCLDPGYTISSDVTALNPDASHKTYQPEVAQTALRPLLLVMHQPQLQARSKWLKS